MPESINSRFRSVFLALAFFRVTWNLMTCINHTSCEYLSSRYMSRFSLNFWLSFLLCVWFIINALLFTSLIDFRVWNNSRWMLFLTRGGWDCAGYWGFKGGGTFICGRESVRNTCIKRGCILGFRMIIGIVLAHDSRVVRLMVSGIFPLHGHEPHLGGHCKCQ